MSERFRLADNEVIDVGKGKRRHWRRWVLAAIALLLLILSRTLGIYLSAAWFSSLGFSSVYWYIFKLKLGLFFVFLVATAVLLRGAFWLLERHFKSYALEKRTIVVNNQPVQISPERFVRPASWIIAILFALFYGLAMKGSWQTFALYFNQAQVGTLDPIFHKPVSFYLFSLPFYDLISSWLITLSFVVLCASIIYSLLAAPPKVTKANGEANGKRSFAAVSVALAAFLVLLAWQTYLSRFPYLWEDHQTFTGVSFSEAQYLLPALRLVAIGLLIAAAVALINAFTKRGLKLILFGLALPLAVFVVGVLLVPAYVTSFIVKPNELGRETPYIEENITWTRRAFGLEQVELREFEADSSVESLDLNANRPTLDNIRLWDWHALQDTLKQIQAIRTYYDFPDVDVDRYKLSDTTRQMMVAAREIDLKKLPDASRNWINEKLIYTHGYGITMNTANGFTPEGMPRFVVSDMPITSSSPEVKVTRPEIYFGQETNSDVYVKTKQKEFDFPQGEANTYTTYEGTGGIQIGGRARRMLLAWALGDLSRLPFSDDVTPESRVLIHRNIREMVNGIAPFLTYDNDPYIVVNSEGRLFWMLDAFTESATYPYSRHQNVGQNNINYIRNSVKVTIDAYNGTVHFYVFDPNDPLIQTYRATFPALFEDAGQMPADLRAHIRYPETLIRAQGEIYGLYHTQSPKVFFQREDVWNVAQQISLDDQNRKQVTAIDPYFVLMQLPGEQIRNEFVLILPFTPASRNNMIGWMAGRCDGENYGKLLIYNFPKSRLIDGPLQIEARIDQNAQLSSQFTLWNQQGSHVLRGHLLVIPIGKSLLYVEPVYLKAESSPMPELRLVVLAIQDRLGYGKTFDEAMTNLFGETGPPAEQKPGEQPAKPAETPAQPGASPGASPAPRQDAQQLINKAVQELEDYQRLTSQGKLGEAGQKLEQHKRTMEELKRIGGKSP
ncbi:MAG TPA: membrane protein [Blastocatellia bacterium]|nr:membrane protein [Blastocatellia bacterium]